MASKRFIYNKETCAYEPYRLKGSALRNRLMLILSISFAMAAGGYATFLKNSKPFDVLEVERENANLKTAWFLLNYRIGENEDKLRTYAEEDDKNYRVILDAEVLSKNERQAGVGGVIRKTKELEQHKIISQTFDRAQHLNNQLTVQNKSFDELQKLLDRKLKQWASRPAIQPIDNKKLMKLYTTFGMRFNPVLKYWRPHKGLDFKAAIGTPIYATGDGVVQDSYYSDSFGNVVYIDHGFDFETRYAHMVRFIVSKGEKVKRGQVIGYVGDTGNSAGEHLHYEVLYKGEQINPINFFQRDLSNSEYKKLLELAKNDNGSLD
jgi:murein DD-endopeptidase MepM/ murein hydrolase activator NlpD